jgi:hypothetical protein
MREPELTLPLCMNHARTPGVIREVHPCECCRNFERRPEPSRGSTPPPRGPEVKYIPLGQRQFAIVDAADFDWLNQYTWHLLGGNGVVGYAYRYEGSKRIFMHREIMQTPPGFVADHKDRNPLHNRRSNLRNCRPQDNQHNRRRAPNQSGFVGVIPIGRSGGPKSTAAARSSIGRSSTIRSRRPRPATARPMSSSGPLPT